MENGGLRDGYLSKLYRQGYRELTIVNRQHLLSRFIAWAHKRGIDVIDDLDEFTLNDYRYHLDLERRLGGFRDSPLLQTRHLECLRRWLSWVHAEDWTETDLSKMVANHSAVAASTASPTVERLVSGRDQRTLLRWSCQSPPLCEVNHAAWN